MAKLLKISSKNHVSNQETSFLDTVPITTGDIDVIASRIAARKLLDSGWEIADLNNLVPFSSYPHSSYRNTLINFLEMGSIKFLKENLTRTIYTIEKRDELRRETYVLGSLALDKSRRQAEVKGEIVHEEYDFGNPNKVRRITYSDRKRNAPWLLFFRCDEFKEKRCRFIEIPENLARLLLKMLPPHAKFVPIDYLALTPGGYLFVEQKANKARLSKKQFEVSKMIQKAGYKVAELHVSLSLGSKAEIRCCDVDVVKG